MQLSGLSRLASSFLSPTRLQFKGSLLAFDLYTDGDLSSQDYRSLLCVCVCEGEGVRGEGAGSLP